MIRVRRGSTDRRPVRIAAALLCGLVGGATTPGCTSQESSAAPTTHSAVGAAGADIPDVLATVGGDAITIADVRSRIGDDLDRLEINYQRARSTLLHTTLAELLRDRVLVAEAREQGTDVEALVAAEAGGSLEPSEVEISAWYQDNRARVGGRTLEQVRTQIAEYLRNERRSQAMADLERRLKEEREVTVHLEPFRVSLDNEGAPAVGPRGAPVTLVEFSDFECPFCGRFYPTLKQVENEFGEDVRIVYRQYPIPSLHPNAQKAAEASLCADQQGRFWETHDLLFQEQDRLTVRDLKDKAGRLGLDQKAFDQCLDSGRFVEQVQRDQEEGSRVGVTGTPAVFVNGILLEGGAVAYEVVAKAVREELERSNR